MSVDDRIQGAIADVTDILRQAALASDSREPLLALACEAMQGGRLAAAQELFDLVVMHDPLSEVGFLGLTVAHHRAGHAPAAHRCAGQAETLHRLVHGASRADLYRSLLAELEPRPAPPRPPAVQPKEAWYKSMLSGHPSREALAGDTAAFDRYFLAGLIPDAPIIAKTDDVATIGSCFATHIATYLHRQGRRRSKTGNAEFQHDNIYIDDDFFNTFVLREAFEIAFGVQDQGRNWRSGSETQDAPRAILYNREHISRVLGSADAYVVTLGLAEIWFDKRDGTVFPSGLNIDVFDSERHGFRVSTVDENLANLERIVDLVRRHRGDVPIIVTLSPVPLSATFRPLNCVAANTVSKAVLRLAVDRLMAQRAGDRRLFYFPSFEIVTTYFADPFADDLRHVKEDVVDFVMHAFARTFLAD